MQLALNPFLLVLRSKLNNNGDCSSTVAVMELTVSDAVTTQQQINKIKKQTLVCIIHGHLCDIFWETPDMRSNSTCNIVPLISQFQEMVGDNPYSMV